MTGVFGVDAIYTTLTHHNDRVKPVASICNGCLNIQKSASINAIRTLSQQRTVIPLNRIYGFVLIMKTTCILCEVGSRVLHFSSTDFKIPGGLSRRRPGFDLRPVLCEISGDQSGSGPGFSHTNSIFPGHYHNLNVNTYLHLHATLSKRTSGQCLGTLKKRRFFPEIVRH